MKRPEAQVNDSTVPSYEETAGAIAHVLERCVRQWWRNAQEEAEAERRLDKLRIHYGLSDWERDTIAGRLASILDGQYQALQKSWARIRSLESQVSELRKALELAIDAIDSLPDDALGTASAGFEEWPITAEVADKLRAALRTEEAQK